MNLDRTLIVRLVIAWGFSIYKQTLWLPHTKRTLLSSSSLISRPCRLSARFDCQKRTVAVSLASGRLGDAFD